MKRKKGKGISVSRDTLEWFSKLTLIQRLKCIEEQLKTIHILRKMKPQGLVERKK